MSLDKGQELKHIGLNGIQILKQLVNSVDHKAEEIQDLVAKINHRCEQMEESVNLLCEKLKEESKKD